MTNKVRWGKSTYGMMRYLTREPDGTYRLQWQGNVVHVIPLKQGPYRWIVQVDGHTRWYAPNFNAALDWVDNVWGEEEVETTNILNPGSRVMIARKRRGGCCDPGTETYHCM